MTAKKVAVFEVSYEMLRNWLGLPATTRITGVNGDQFNEGVRIRIEDESLRPVEECQVIPGVEVLLKREYIEINRVQGYRQ